MHTTEQYREALQNYAGQGGVPDGTDYLELIRYDEMRGQVRAYRRLLETNGVELLDQEIGVIWQWHSGEWDAQWLMYGDETDLEYFEEFADRWFPQRRGDNH